VEGARLLAETESIGRMGALFLLKGITGSIFIATAMENLSRK
jgi:hypothetical protein